MHMPGFTAEDSLYMSRAQYHITGAGFLVVNAKVVPQARPECISIVRVARSLAGAFTDAVADGSFVAASDFAHVLHDMLDLYNVIGCP
jgi:hypothetical protein